MSSSKLTPGDVLRLKEAQKNVVTALNSALETRDAMLRKYRADGVSVSELANAIGLHRSQVNRVTNRTGND